MIKAKNYEWKDSNMELFGSNKEKQVKKESAKEEKAWEGAGEKEGLQIWRINKFQVEHWDKDNYGEFYNGDSYIILNTYKIGDELAYDVHFWIGKYSTQDEYGTAAYKTVELDTYLDDKAVQHREVQGNESPLFKSYFPSLSLLKGGASSGFKKDLPEEYKPRLFVISKEESNRVTCTEIALKKGNLNSDDVFIFDNGLEITQYNGKNSSNDEKFKGAQELQSLKSKRAGKPKIETLEEEEISPDHKIFSLLADGESKPRPEKPKGERKMFKISDGTDMAEIASGDDISKDKLDTNDVFIINTGDHVYCWVGKGASVDERRNGLPYAANYLMKTETPFLPISVVAEGRETEDFNKAF